MIKPREDWASYEKMCLYFRLFVRRGLCECGNFPRRGLESLRNSFYFLSSLSFSCFHCRNLVNIQFNQQRKYNLPIVIRQMPGFYWNRNVKCVHFPPERVCIRRDEATCRSKSFPSMLADEMQTQSNQSGRNHNPPPKCQSPLSSLCVWWEIIVWENLLILANTLSALICPGRICLY